MAKSAPVKVVVSASSPSLGNTPPPQPPEKERTLLKARLAKKLNLKELSKILCLNETNV
jgi:hypothetical protein